MRSPVRAASCATMLLFAAAFAVPLLLATPAQTRAASGAATAVDEIDRLIDTGADALALRVIDQDQPPLSESLVGWQRYEHRRLHILAFRADWPALIDRVGGYPPAISDDFRSHAGEALARAHLASGDGQAATRVLAELIWGPAQDTAMVHERSARLVRWRALLAESYLLADRLDDARTSMLRFRLDYGDAPDGWRLLLAKALVRGGDDAGARDLLQGLETTEVAYLRLLMRARAPGVDPLQLLSQMRPMLGEGRLTPAERSQLWASLAAAAAAYRDHTIRVTAMEQAVALAAPVVARDRFVRVDADDLWDAYEAHAAALANEARLLVGRFGAWLDLARSYDGAGDVRARALYAYLASQIRDARVAAAARTHLAEALAGEPRGLTVLAALYLDSDRYPRVADVPAELRAPLVAYAVESARTNLAAELLAGLDAPTPDGVTARWRAPVAVALVENGRVEAALALVAEEGAHGGGTSAPTIGTRSDAQGDLQDDVKGDALADALARVALALQAAGEYRRSATLASRALTHAREPGRRRALLMLGADAEAQAGRHERAARLYIAAARLSGEGGVDSHARTAGLQAARMLARAGLYADAVAVLEHLRADGAHTDWNDVFGQMLRRY